MRRCVWSRNIKNRSSIYIYIYIYIYDISSLRINDLTLILLTWRKWWALNNASKWQMGFNSAFKGLIFTQSDIFCINYHRYYFQLLITIPFNIIVNDMGSHTVHTFYVPRLCSVLAWWWPHYSRNMLPRRHLQNFYMIIDIVYCVLDGNKNTTNYHSKTWLCLRQISRSV